MFTDGTPGYWTFLRPGFGTLNGLVVGSTGAGKSRALGVLIVNLLEAGWMVAIGDPQNGQSLPSWRDAAGEFHQGPEAVRSLLRRLYAEVMRRSELLSAVGVQVFDENDPRVKKLGLKKLAAVIDECQMVLIANDKDLIALVEDLLAIDRKTGVAVIFATQIPQMKSLGGSIRIRDALVAGNAFIMRLSNRGSGVTVLPDDFVGDPFALEAEINGKTTAGMGYLRNAAQQGMLSRVAMLDEDAAAAAAPRTSVEWQVPPIDPTTPIPAVAKRPSSDGNGGGAAAKLRALFAGKTTATPVRITEQAPTSTPEWVLACLRRAPASAQALLDRPDCPVKQPQLYAVLKTLSDSGRIVAPAQRGGQFTIA
jgi:ribosomal protein L7Ae-like RNA K-turn-binding protein